MTRLPALPLLLLISLLLSGCLSSDNKGSDTKPGSPTPPVNQPTPIQPPSEEDLSQELGNQSGVTALIDGQRHTTRVIDYTGAPLSIGTGYLTAGAQNDPFRVNISGITTASGERICADNGIPSLSITLDGVSYHRSASEGHCSLTTLSHSAVHILVSFNGTLYQAYDPDKPSSITVTSGEFQYLVETFAPGEGTAQVQASFEGLEPGTLHQQQDGTGDRGWQGSWNSPVANLVDVSDSPLSLAVTGHNGGLSGGDTAISITSFGDFSSSGRELEKHFAGDVYLSLLVRVADGTALSRSHLTLGNAAVFIGIDNSNDASVDGPRQNQFVVSLGDNEDQRAYAGGALQNDATFHLAGRLYKSSGSANYDRFDLWVNPARTAGSNPAATAERTAGTGSLRFVNEVGMASLNQFTPLQLDRIRLSDTWDGLFND